MARSQTSPKSYLACQRLDIRSQVITANSTGVNFSAAIFLTGQATIGKLSANSTAILLPATGLQFAALTSLKVTSNSTGVRIGARYISTNTTGNATT